MPAWAQARTGLATVTRIRAELGKVLSSTLFVNSPRMSRFLRFVVETALDGNGDYAYLDTLAAALASAGEFEDAKETQEKAIQIAPDAKGSELRARLNLYKSGQPFRTTSRTARGEDPESQR